MLVYRTLTEDDFPHVHDCFVRAFADYELPAQPTPDDMRRMFSRRGMCHELSVGVFEGDAIAAMTVVGLGTWKGDAATYDITTGVLPEYRGRGIATEMINWIRPAMRAAGSRRMLLECLQSNTPAIKAYRRAGFRETRELVVLGLELDVFRVKSPVAPGIRVVGKESPDWNVWQTFDEREASWQNSIESTIRGVEPAMYFEARDGDTCVGYAACSRKSRELFRLAVAPGRRRQGIGSALMQAAVDCQESSPLRIINIDATAAADLAFYQAVGARELIRQFEMELDLTD